ncbi:MAG: hypothetical protein ABI333_13260 [bacterium]
MTIRLELTAVWPAVLAILCSFPAAGCRKKKSTPKAGGLALTWNTLAVGMTRKEVDKRLGALGWGAACKPSDTATYLAGAELFTRYVKQSARSRTQSCGAAARKGTKVWSPPVRLIKLFYLDGRLARLNVLVPVPDSELGPLLSDRFGKLLGKQVTRHAYGGKRSGQFRVWTLERKGVALVWLRSAKMQELVFFAVDKPTLKALEAVTTTSRDG